jgi:uncharacterized glyoxalase superfamily protein PhnB
MSTPSQRNYFRPGFRSITPYLVTTGAARLIDFLKTAFDAQEVLRVPNPDGSVMHAEVRVGDSMVELADGGGKYPPTTPAVHYYVNDADEAYKRALAAGAKSLYEPADRNYGDREAGIKDPSGNTWYLARRLSGGYRPEGLRDITPYLHLRGAPAFLEFLKNAFDAGEDTVYRDPDGRIAHAAVRIGDSVVEFGEAHGQWAPTRSAIHLYVPDADAAYERALAAGATPLDAPKTAEYGDRTANVVDAFGNHWYLATHLR